MTSPAETMTEKSIHSAVIAHWRMLGVPGSIVATIPNERAHGQPGLTAGLPDLIVISPRLGSKVGFIELKREGGKVSPAQRAFADLCWSRGISFAITYGRDQPIEVLELWGAVTPRKEL